MGPMFSTLDERHDRRRIDRYTMAEVDDLDDLPDGYPMTPDDLGWASLSIETRVALEPRRRSIWSRITGWLTGWASDGR